MYRRLKRIIAVALVTIMTLLTPMTSLAEVNETGDGVFMEEITGIIQEEGSQEDKFATPSEVDERSLSQENSTESEENDLSVTSSEIVNSDIELCAIAEDGMTVILNADANAFEYSENLTLEANVVSEEVAREADKELSDETENDNIAKRVTYDIRVMHNGEEIQPVDSKMVKIEFAMSDVPSGADAISVYHHNEESETIETIIDEAPVKEDDNQVKASEAMTTEKDEISLSRKHTERNIDDSTDVDDEGSLEDGEIIDDITVEGETGSFSLYTVDFTYEEKTVSIPGETDHNKLSNILTQLNIKEEIEVAIAYQDADCKEIATDGTVYSADGSALFIVYEEDGIWYMDAMNAFQTEHGLIVKTAVGAEYKIKVTDDAQTTTNVKYIDAFGNEQTRASVTAVDDTMTGTWEAGWYVVNSNVTMTESVAIVSGDVHLILADGYTLNITGADGNAGIRVTGSNSLTIYGQAAGTGTLNTTGGNNGAGIGGCFAGMGSNITINGGTVIAIGGKGGAGIGGGSSYSDTNKEGKASNITINGGKVTASGGRAAAGIGSGWDGDASNITINGGTVSANGGIYGAGIGGGMFGTVSNITISGGKVIAIAGEEGAGIGGGFKGLGSNITINGGDVTANGGEFGSGIGGGNAGSGNNITINKGTVTATGGYVGAGIGGGLHGSGSNIIIYGGTVTATGGEQGAGIGSGKNGGGSSSIKADETVIVKAGDSINPTNVIAHDDTTDITGSVSQRYVLTVQECKITWNSGDGEFSDLSTTKTTKALYGETPEAPEIPTKASTDEYTYTFTGWEPSITTVTGETTYTAQYSSTKNSYTITWDAGEGKFADQETTKTSVAEYGETPEAPEIPTKDNTAADTYVFSHWSPSISSVTGNQTYTAQYSSTKNSYSITWDAGEGKFADQEPTKTTLVEYGETPEAPEIPTKASTDEYTYTFTGWEPSISTVSGETTYIAQYSSTKKEKKQDEESGGNSSSGSGSGGSSGSGSSSSSGSGSSNSGSSSSGSSSSRSSSSSTTSSDNKPFKTYSVSELTGSKESTNPVSKDSNGNELMQSSLISKPVEGYLESEKRKMIRKGGKAQWTVVNGKFRLSDESGQPIQNAWGLVADDVYHYPVGNASYYYFDENGDMLVGWQWIKDADGKWRQYYFNEELNALFGACLMGGTRDGKTLNENGQVVVNGVVLEFDEKPVQ